MGETSEAPSLQHFILQTGRGGGSGGSLTAPPPRRRVSFPPWEGGARRPPRRGAKTSEEELTQDLARGRELGEAGQGVAWRKLPLLCCIYLHNTGPLTGTSF